MKTWKWLRRGAAGFSIAIVAGISAAFAWETDQFNPAPAGLPDLGAEVSEHVVAEIEAAIRDLNAQITHHETCLRMPRFHPDCATRIARDRGAFTFLAQPHLKLASELRSEAALLDAIYDRLGNGFPTPKIEKFFANHTFRRMPALYKAPFSQSLYRRDVANYLTMAPTVRMYGVELGTDKIAHLFQQGHDFYAQYRAEIARGRAELAAQSVPIEWSRGLERGFFGTAIVGIYANADLAANYAGFWFYRNLLSDIQLDAQTLPRLVTLEAGRWQLVEPTSRAHVLAPYITDHLNEALNPSSYNFSQQEPIRQNLAGPLCQAWLKAMDTLHGRAQLARADAGELAHWYGMDYGFTPIEPDSRFILECRPGQALSQTP